MTTPTPPKKLTRSVRKFFKEIVGKFELTEGQLALFQEACRDLSHAEMCDSQVETDGLLLVNRHGERVPHPCLQQGRLARQNAIRTLALLGLNESEDEKQ